MATRLRFTTEDDLCALRAILRENPYQDRNKWTAIQEQVVAGTGKQFTKRAIREHSDHLVGLYFSEDHGNLKKTGTEQQYREKQQLLQEIINLRTEFQHSSPVTQHTYLMKHQRLLKINDTNVRETLQDSYLNNSSALENTPPHTSETESEIPIDANNVQIFDNQLQLHHEMKLEPAEFDDDSYSSTPSELIGVEGLVSSVKRKCLPANKTDSHKKQRHNTELALREKELALEERRLVIEERKLALEEAKLQLEVKEREHRRMLESEEKKIQINLNNQQQKLIETLLEHINKKNNN